MDERYIRNIPALTEEECVLLGTKHIAVIGCGGIGGHIIDQAARLGIGTIRVIDGDVFNKSNLNRQLLCSEAAIGKYKVNIAKEHVSKINSTCITETYCTMLTSENALHLLTNCDLAIDALDNIEARHILAQAASTLNIPVVYGAIRGWVAQAAIYRPDEPLIEMLYPNHVRLTDKSVLSFTPALCAALQMALAVKLLIGRPVQSATLYYVDLLNQEFENINLL